MNCTATAALASTGHDHMVASPLAAFDTATSAANDDGRAAGAMQPAFGRRGLAATFGAAGGSAGVMQAVATHLAGYARGDLGRDLAALLACDAALRVCAQRSYRHANGFFKIVLDAQDAYKLRLHVWLPDADAEENIHEHRWLFASTVVCGTLVSELYAEDASAGSTPYRELVYTARKGCQAPRHEERGMTRLACEGVVSHRAGDSYVMRPATLHKVLRTGGTLTATLMCQTRPTRDWNRMFRAGTTDPDVRQQSLDAACLRRVLVQLLAVMAAQ